jgi:hypothetical protein
LGLLSGKEAKVMNRFKHWAVPQWRQVMIMVVLALAAGCETPSPHTISRNYSLRGEVPIDPPRPHAVAEDDCVAGGRLFQLYCGSCHNARPLGERPFSNYQVAVAHMRDQAYLTGKEYRQIIHFLRRWDDVGPPTPAVRPSPKRLVFSQPIAELRDAVPTPGLIPPPPRTGPWQPGDKELSASPPPTSRRDVAAPVPPTGLPAPIE